MIQPCKIKIKIKISIHKITGLGKYLEVPSFVYE
jgi:hypothetical protein